MNGTNSVTNGDWVRLNVGGKVFQTTKDTLSRYPGTFLACLVSGDVPSDKDETGAFLIDRDPKHFRIVLNFLRNGVLHMDSNQIATKELLCEADFYGLQALIEEINKLRPGTNSIETITLSVEYLKEVRQLSQIVCSEKRDDYDILQTIRDKYRYKYRLIDKIGVYSVIEQIGINNFRTLSEAGQVGFETILRSFGFVQESVDDNYAEGNGFRLKRWKFVRTASK